MKEIIIDKRYEKKTVISFLKSYLNNAPYSIIEKQFRNKDVKVNGVRVNRDYILSINDKVTIYINDTDINKFHTEKTISSMKHKLDIVYEDNNILIVNKEKGLLVHGDKNEKKMTLQNEVIEYLTIKGEYKAKDSFIPSPSNRIDRLTSGLVVFSKTREALKEMNRLFESKDLLNKYYLALVIGKVNKEGIINKNLIFDSKTNTSYVSNDVNSKPSITKYRLIEEVNNYSLIECELLTGRTHQIRSHMKFINHPLVGDKKYGKDVINKLFKEKYNYEGQFLHSYKLKFNNIDGLLSYLSNKEIEIKLNKKEELIISKLKEY